MGRTKSIQEKLLMLSQSQDQSAPKENFSSSRIRSSSKDCNKNANMVPIARKDKNHVIRSNRPPSRSRNLNTYERLRSRSRSGNRISGQREQNRTRSRSMNKISGQREKNRMRTRSRSENRISGQREISHRSPARRGRSPLGKKKGSQDLSQIN